MVDEPAYVISVVARVLQMHPQTLRKYERAGLLRPSRTGALARLYSDSDLARLRLIKRLVDETGLNVAGVGVVLRLVERIERIEALAGQEGAVRTRAEAARLLRELGMAETEPAKAKSG